MYFRELKLYLIANYIKAEIQIFPKWYHSLISKGIVEKAQLDEGNIIHIWR